MEIPIKIDSDTKFTWIVKIMSCLQPYESLRPKEREVVEKLLKLTYELKSLPKEQRDLLIFHQSNKKKVADELNITVDNYYNIVLSLRKKGLVDEHGIVDKYCIPFMRELNNINFKFIE